MAFAIFSVNQTLPIDGNDEYRKFDRLLQTCPRSRVLIRLNAPVVGTLWRICGEVERISIATLRRCGHVKSDKIDMGSFCWRPFKIAISIDFVTRACEMNVSNVNY